MKTRFGQHTRRGGTLVLVAVSLTFIMGMAALAIDIARIRTAQTDLKISADSAALAGVGTLLNDGRLKGTAAWNAVLASARLNSAEFAGRNKVFGQAPTLDANSSNSPDGDVVIGYLRDPTDRNAPLDLTTPSRFNAMQILVQRNETRNGSIAMTFAQLLGYSSTGLAVRATAMFQDGVVGYRVQTGGQNAHLLPFALKDTAWLNLLATVPNGNNDKYSYDPQTGQATLGSDGIPELNLYPGAGAGQLPPGNFGTVDIGSPNNSTADLSRQIRNGVSADDLAYFGGELKLGADGTLLLNGDTGLSAAVKDDLEAVKGQPRAIALFRSVAGNGNNSYYTVTGFAGVRIVNVKLTGPMNSKELRIQPACVSDGSAIATGSGSSYYVYRPVVLCR